VADHDVTGSSVLARWQASNITNAVYIIQIREINSRSIHYTAYNWLVWKQLQQVNMVYFSPLSFSLIGERISQQAIARGVTTMGSDRALRLYSL
jgi:hypothetical protein